jgi:hypothetical protein
MGYSYPTGNSKVEVPSIIPEEKKDSKAFKRFEKFYKKSVEKPLSKFVELEADLRLEHALEIDGKLVRNAQGGYEYNKEGQKALIAGIRALEDHKVDVDYDVEKESWDDLIALVPDNLRSKCSIEDLEEVFLPFYIQA